MKKNLMALLLVVAFAVASNLAAATAEREKVIAGEGACAKCVLHKTETCQNTITTEEDGKKVIYYLTKNEVDKKFGSALCEEKKKIKATGTIKTVAGKFELTPTKIELVKD